MQLLPIRKVDICQQARYIIRILIAKQSDDLWNISRISIRIAPVANPSDDSRIISDFFQKGFVNLNEFVALTCALRNPITRV